MTDAKGTAATLFPVTGLGIRCADSLKGGFNFVIATDCFWVITDRVAPGPVAARAVASRSSGRPGAGSWPIPSCEEIACKRD
ncbi:hypothetical protein [Streptomyces sp. NPDC003877]